MCIHVLTSSLLCCIQICNLLDHVNSLLARNVIWRHKSGSTLAWVMVCCLMAPSHHLNLCWFLTNEVVWHSPESNLTVNAQVSILYNEFENHNFEITVTPPRVQWVIMGLDCTSSADESSWQFFVLPVLMNHHDHFYVSVWRDLMIYRKHSWDPKLFPSSGEL